MIKREKKLDFTLHYYISFIDDPTLSCYKLRLDNDDPTAPLLFHRSTTDDRQCRSTKSLSNMSNSRRFCPALTARSTVDERFQIIILYIHRISWIFL